MALSRLGASTITSLTDGTTEAKLCNTFYDILARRVMMQGSWTSTIRRASLAKTTNTPSFGYTNEFQLPVDPKCLKVLNVNESVIGTTDYKIEGDKLLTDEPSIKIKYIAELTDPSEYGPLLTEVIEILLASYLSLPIMSNATLTNNLKREYMSMLENNLAIDGQQGSKEIVNSNTLIEVR